MHFPWRQRLNSPCSRALVLVAAWLCTLLPFATWADGLDDAWLAVPYCAVADTGGPQPQPQPSRTIVLHFASAAALLGVDVHGVGAPPAARGAVFTPHAAGTVRAAACAEVDSHDSLGLPAARAPPRDFGS